MFAFPRVNRIKTMKNTTAETLLSSRTKWLKTNKSPRKTNDIASAITDWMALSR